MKSSLMIYILIGTLILAVRGTKESVTMIKNIRERCEERDDALGSFVMTRVGLCSDLVAEEAVYHSDCRVLFFDDKMMTK